MAFAKEDGGNNKETNHPLDLEEGENLMFRRTLIRDSMKEEPSQRRALFRVKFKVKNNGPCNTYYINLIYIIFPI